MQTKQSPHPVAAPRNRGRRRRYIVNPAFQWKYASTITVVVFFLSTIFCTLMYYALHQQARIRAIHPGMTPTSATYSMMFFALGFSVMSAGIIALWCLMSSQKICGPLFVLEGYMKELGDGHIPIPRDLRKGDAFHGFYAEFRRAMESMRGDRESMLQEITEMQAGAQSAINADSEARKHALTALARKLDVVRRRMGASLGSQVPPTPAAAPVEKKVEAPRIPVGAA